ncbi:MAG: hypothetical protein EBR82_70090, partial [Caulobacteraceae bacterium]|nr:hypothetical protein [Caulobacteraceae bacterium]
MNEEAIKYAHELFTKDGYTGGVSDFKELIKSNPDAVDHAFKLFSADGYSGKLKDFKALMGLSEELKKKEVSKPVSTEPANQPTKPSATTGGLDYTRPSAEKSLYGKTIGGIVERSAPLRSQTKEKPKQPPMDVTYTPEAMPSETTQSVVPKSTQEKVKTFDVAEKEIEQGQLPSNPELRTPETVAKVEKKREELGMNTLEEAAATTVKNIKEDEYNEKFADVEDIVDDYIRYSDNKSAMFGAPDYDFGSGKGEWAGLPGLGGRLQESKEGGTDIERQGKRGEILNTVMNDYFSYLQKTNPSQAEAFRNKYSAIKSSTDRDANDEKFLQGLESHALKLRAAAIKKNMDVYKTAIEQYSQIEKRVNFQGYDKDVKDLNQSAKNLNQELKNGNISEEEYAVRWGQLQKGFEDAKIKNGLTDDVVRQLDGAKQVYFAYGQEAMKVSSLFGFMDQNSKEYRE